MDRADIIDFLQKAGRILLAIGLAFLASWILSLLTPGFVQIINEARGALRAIRGKIDNLIQQIASVLEAFWQNLSLEPRVPIIVALRRLSDAVENIPNAAAARFHTFHGRLTSPKLQYLFKSLAVEPPSQVREFIEGATRGREGLGLSILLFAMGLAFGATNSFLLSLFFKEVLGSFRLLPFPLPDLEASHVLALLIALMEIASGIALHLFERLESDKATVRFFRLVPWLAIAALTSVETIAYSLLSVQMQMTTRLHIEPSSGWFPVVQYFFGFFGAVLSVLLASLGYLLSTAWREYSANRRHLIISRQLKAYSQAAESLRKGQFRDDIDRLGKGMVSLPCEIDAALSRVTGASADRAVVVSDLGREVGGILDSCSPQGERAARDVRSRSQVIADLWIQLFLLAGWAGLVLLIVRTISSYLASVDPIVVSVSPATRAWLIVLVTSAFGFLARESYPASAYATVTSATISNPHARRVFFVIAVLGLLPTSCVIVAVPILNHSIGESPIVNAAFGALLAIALPLLSSGLDAALLSVTRAGHWVSLRCSMAMLYASQLLSLAIEAVLFCAIQLLRLLSVPGDWIASLYKPQSE